jgi:hypothetical protein
MSGSGFAVTGFRARGPTGPTPAGGSIPELSFTNRLDDSGDYNASQVPIIERAFERSLETFCNGFAVHEYRSGSSFCAAGNESCG